MASSILNRCYTWLVAGCLFPLHELLKKHRTVQIKQQLELTQWQSTEQILDAQQRRLQSFIRDMEHNEQQRNITASLIRLASYLQIDVIATGIENEMQAYLLHVMGCDILQGHLFSKALPASEVPALLARENRLLRKEVS